MTNNISIRPRRAGLRAEIARRAKPNVNAWLNDLIERELDKQPVDWRDILDRERPKVSEELFERCLKPE